MCDPEVAIGYYENLMKTGLRMVSPAGRQDAALNWINTFNNLGVQNEVRIDVIAVHWYDWYSDPQNSPNADPNAIFERFKNYLSNVYELYSLPIWITEFNANKYRTSDVNEAFMRLAIPYLENTSYIERYAWFEPVPVNNNNIGNGEFFDINGNLSSMGLFYKNYESTSSIPENFYANINNLSDATQNNDYIFTCYPSNLLNVEQELQMANKTFKFFPNPAKNQIQFQSDETIEYIYIYNIKGYLISKIKTNNLIDISTLKPGVYIMKVNNNSTKLIKK